MLLFRTTTVHRLTSVESNVNLFDRAGSPKDARNVIFFNSANKTSSNTSPAMALGAPWKGGSTVYLENTATITGAPGDAGTPGTSGSGGAGGIGGAGSGALTAATAGSSGGPGGNGTPGSAGSTSLQVDSNPSVRFILDNRSGTITGGSGGSGGPAGQGGGGGGGGGIGGLGI